MSLYCGDKYISTGSVTTNWFVSSVVGDDYSSCGYKFSILFDNIRVYFEESLRN